MRLGLKNPQTAFQKAIVVTFLSVLWQLAVVYLDEIVVFYESPLDYIK